MAKYSDIKGFTVQTVSTDPVASQGAGGTWSSGGDMNTARIATTGTSSSSTNSIIGGGYYLPPTVNRSLTEAYDGSTWSELSDHPVSIVYGNGLGVKTAALIAGIDVSASPTNSQTYIFDGSSWSAPGASINTMKYMSATGGTTTAGIISGGNTPPASATTETWNGSSWTEVADLNTGKTNLGGGTGTSTALMAVGGTPATIEVYDGSSWTEIAEMNTSRSNTSKGGIVTAAIVTNGYAGPNYPAQTELYDGTSWTEVGDTPIGIGYASNISSGQPGGQTDAVLAGGQTSTAFSATTLEWSAPAVFSKITEGQLFFNSTTNTFKETIKDAPTGTWASGGTMNQARIYSLITSVSGGPSGQSDAFAVSGANPSTSNVANAETYNGSSWTEVGDVNSARRLGNGCGGQPAAVVAGGYTTGDVASTEVWNGSSWTETGDLNSAKRQFAGSFGTTDSSSDLLVAGAFPLTANTEIWDGSSWTETGNLNQQRYDGAGFGTSSTAGLIAGGQSSPSPIPGQTAYAENWNGSSWTEVAEFNTNRFYLAAAGEQTDGLIFGGSLDPGLSGTTEIWNGSSWTELNDMSAGVQGNGGGGSSVAAISFSGDIGPGAGGNTSEEFTAGLSNKTITAS